MYFTFLKNTTESNMNQYESILSRYYLCRFLYNAFTTLLKSIFLKQVHRLNYKNQVKVGKAKGSMAELVDAPDSKSGHFGGVGSIPSTPTINNI